MSRTCFASVLAIVFFFFLFLDVENLKKSLVYTCLFNSRAYYRVTTYHALIPDDGIRMAGARKTNAADSLH